MYLDPEITRMFTSSNNMFMATLRAKVIARAPVAAWDIKQFRVIFLSGHVM
jgi:hypothetical protein